MNKLAVIAAGLHVVVFALLIPVLETNSSHLTNPLWPSHARLHEAWQLLTNAGIAIFALALVVSRKSPVIGVRLGIITSLSFLVAWASGGAYGGSMLHADGSQMAIAGLNVAVIIVMALVSLQLASEFQQRKSN